MLTAVAVLLMFSFSPRAYAAPCTPDPSNPSCKCTGPPVAPVCDDGKASATPCSSGGALKDNCIVKDINQIVDFLSAGVAVVVVGVIIVGGIQYSLAGDKPEAVGAAKKRITNGLIALVVFILTFAFLQWLIPGGVFS